MPAGIPREVGNHECRGVARRSGRGGDDEFPRVRRGRTPFACPHSAAAVSPGPRAEVVPGTGADQGGCFADSRSTTHDAVRASTWALTNVTLPCVAALADRGFRRAVGDGPASVEGVGVGVVRVEVAEARGPRHVTPAER